MTLTNEELTYIVRELKSGAAAERIARDTGISDALILEIRSLVGTMPNDEAERLIESGSLNQALCGMIHQGLDSESFHPPIAEKYRVGEIADRIGFTKEMVRNYEEYGIIESHRDPDNGYRWFDCNALWEANKLRSFRSMGFSLQESKELLVCDDLERMVNAFQQRMEVLQQNMARLSALLQTVKKVEMYYEQLKNDRGQCTLEPSPELLWLKHIRPQSSDREALRTMSAWTGQMPLVRIGVRYWVSGHCVRVEHGYCVPADVVKSIHLPLCGEVKRIPSQMAVRSVIRHKSNMTTGWFKEDIFQHMYAYGREHHLKCGNGIVGIGIVALGSGPERTFYQDAWMPVESE